MHDKHHCINLKYSSYAGLVNFQAKVSLPEVLECQGLSLNLLSKHVMSLILEKHFVILGYFLASLKVLEQL